MMNLKGYRNVIDYCRTENDPSFQFTDDPNHFYDYFWIAAEVLCIISSTIALIGIYRHCTNYNYPLHQRYIIRILFIVPIYGVFTSMSLLLHNHYFLWTVFRDFYEAYAVYSFYWLVRYYLGDSKELQLKTLEFYYRRHLFQKQHVLLERKANGKLSPAAARSLKVIEDFNRRQRHCFFPCLNGRGISWLF